MLRRKVVNAGTIPSAALISTLLIKCVCSAIPYCKRWALRQTQAGKKVFGAYTASKSVETSTSLTEVSRLALLHDRPRST
jgi:hypothetical protein